MLTKTALALSAVLMLTGTSVALENIEAMGHDTNLSVKAEAGYAAFAQASANDVSGINVVVDGTIVGRDPDPNVRQNLRRDSAINSW